MIILIPITIAIIVITSVLIFFINKFVITKINKKIQMTTNHEEKTALINKRDMFSLIGYTILIVSTILLIIVICSFVIKFFLFTMGLIFN